MTPDPQQPKHPSRCDNGCTHYDIPCPGFLCCDKNDRGELRSLSKTDIEFILQMGCASYSSRPHTQAQNPGCYLNCPFNDLAANDIDKIKAIEAEAARTATLAIIAAIRKFYSDLPEHDASCPFDKMNSDECRGYECDCGTCILKHALESLRRHQGGEK